MDTSNDIQALEIISTEVDESQIKVIFSSQCVSAQNFLLSKLRKEAERKKELYHHISRANFKLEMEIKHAELEIKSMRLAHDTIKSANIELKKELLLAKEKNVQIKERIEIGVKKYEALWMESKARFETIPFVRKYLQVTDRLKTIKNDVEDKEKQAQIVYKDIETRKSICSNVDKQRVIELANFMINELPTKTKLIKEKSEAINKLTKQMDELLKAQDCVHEVTEVPKQRLDTFVVNNLPSSTLASDKNDEVKNDFLLPKLELTDFDFDLNDVNLDLVIKRNLEICKNTPETEDPVAPFDPSINDRKDARTDDFIISPYIYKPIYEEKTECFSERKLINILEDVKIDDKEAFNIVSKTNPDKFEIVQEISAEGSKNKATILDTEDIEVVDLTSTINTENILIPPTQFLDIILQVSQENQPKKRVSFDLRSTMQINEINDDENNKPNEEINEQNQSIASQLDISFGCDESFTKIKDLILKRHNLDFSPQFVYARPNVQQKNDDDRLVTSKFFEQEEKCSEVENVDNKITEMDIQPEDKEDAEILNVVDENNSQSQNNIDKEIPMEYDEMFVPSPKTKNENEEKQTQKPISGLLFTHGPQGIPDSLNVSISTAGYEDSDFPHGIDPSLLLSPKADIPMSVDNAEVASQDVPNFLSGLRKTGLSFFGGGPSTSSQPDTNAQNQGNNFNFNFGGDDKKKRGGLFSMFQ